MKIKTIIVIIVIGILLSLLPYIINFISYPISENPSDWADFAGYFGGISGTLLTGFSLLYLIIINNKLFQQSEDHLNNSLTNQRKEDLYNNIGIIKSFFETCQNSTSEGYYYQIDKSKYHQYVDAHNDIQKTIFFYMMNDDTAKLMSFFDRLNLELTGRDKIVGNIYNWKMIGSPNLFQAVSDQIHWFKFNVIKMDTTHETLDLDQFDKDAWKLMGDYNHLFKHFKWVITCPLTKNKMRVHEDDAKKATPKSDQ